MAHRGKTMAVNLPFNERKATEAAAHLLKLGGDRMSYMKLIKLLYLADREALLRFGCPITTDRYVSMDRGPVLSRVLNLITEEREPASQSLWADVISEPERYEVHLNKEIEPEELSDAEIELLDEIFQQYGRLDRWSLVEITHDLPEWVDPHGGAVQISYRDILLNAGKTLAETKVIEQELAALGTSSSLEPSEDAVSTR
jgi:uncharacterized phage-associated protein